MRRHLTPTRMRVASGTWESHSWGCIPISNWPIINRIISYIILWAVYGFYIYNHMCTRNYVFYIVSNCDANPSLGSHISRLRGTSAQNGHVEYEPA